MTDRNFEIDFSGGNPLYYDEDFRIVEQATCWLLSRKIGVSMTGSKITDAKLELLKKVGVVEFTLDNLLDTENPYRPRGYNRASMVVIKKCIAVGIKIRAVTVGKGSFRVLGNVDTDKESGILHLESLKRHEYGK